MNKPAKGHRVNGSDVGFHGGTAVLERLFHAKKKTGYVKGAWVRDVSVVIPAKNEEHRMAGCLGSIMAEPCVREVIVVDGGSSDRTACVAEALGAVVLCHHAPPELGGGRGGQIRQGVMAASGDVVAVVHADTRMAPGTFQRMLETLRGFPCVIGGAAGTIFDYDFPGKNIIEFLNALRAVVFKVSFGDQIQFFRRDAIVQNDLFPAIPLMEDVELSLRMNRLGRTVYLFGKSRVSARRWKEKGLKNALEVIFYFYSYLILRLLKMSNTNWIYRRYYPSVVEIPSKDHEP